MTPEPGDMVLYSWPHYTQRHIGLVLRRDDYSDAPPGVRVFWCVTSKNPCDHVFTSEEQMTHVCWERLSNIRILARGTSCEEA